MGLALPLSPHWHEFLGLSQFLSLGLASPGERAFKALEEWAGSRDFDWLKGQKAGMGLGGLSLLIVPNGHDFLQYLKNLCFSSGDIEIQEKRLFFLIFLEALFG